MRKPGRSVVETPVEGAAVAVENTFARVLAHNDVKIRNRGIKKLKVSDRVRGVHTETLRNVEFACVRACGWVGVL
jgi:hypothetical protein